MWYRNLMLDGDRFFQLAEITYIMSNILLGREGTGAFPAKLAESAERKLRSLYRQLEGYIGRYPLFHTTLDPWRQRGEQGVVNRMIEASIPAEVGPMAAVAGAFADEILEAMPDCAEHLFVENGGDVALRSSREMSVMIHAGDGTFPPKVTILLPPGRWGIASSSGKWGHSFSMGTADMVTVVAARAAVADALATAIANRIKPDCDPEAIIAEVYPLSALRAVAVFWEGRLWYRGDFRLQFH